ncbi:MAG: YybH family protein [Bacteroidales bacterium]
MTQSLRTPLFTLILITLFSCKSTSHIAIENSKREIVEAEKAFAELTKKEGVAAAFLAFADEHAVLNRNDKLVKGKSEMETHFAKQSLKITSLTWTPDFVEVAASGDLGYTYGEYQITYLNKEGKEVSDKGIFHTVWKKQADGKWKFVWD